MKINNSKFTLKYMILRGKFPIWNFQLKKISSTLKAAFIWNEFQNFIASKFHAFKLKFRINFPHENFDFGESNRHPGNRSRLGPDNLLTTKLVMFVSLENHYNNARGKQIWNRKFAEVCFTFKIFLRRKFWLQFDEENFIRFDEALWISCFGSGIFHLLK